MSGSWWAFVLAGLLLISVIFRLGALFLLDVLLLLIAGASWLWSRYCLAGVDYRRHIGRQRLFYGEACDFVIELVNRKPLPLAWLRAEDEFPELVTLLTGHLQAHHVPRRRLLRNLVTMRWYERVRRRYRIRGHKRGIFTFGPAELVSGDIFGFAQKRRRVEAVDELIVYPKVVPVTRLGLPARYPFGDFTAPHHLIEDPLRFMSVRDYTPEDSFRHVHWKATARSQQLKTRVYEPATTRHLLVFLDVQTLPKAYQGVISEYLELAVTTAASVAREAVTRGYQVGLYANTSVRNATTRIRIPPSRAPTQLTRIYTALAQVTHIVLDPIETTIGAEASGLPYGATVVVISALQTADLLAALLDLKDAGHAVTLLVVGDDPDLPILPGIPFTGKTVHIGGRREWYELASLEVA